MPTLTLKLQRVGSLSAQRALAQALTAITANELGKDPALMAVVRGYGGLTQQARRRVRAR